jgi:hypothetical protein
LEFEVKVEFESRLKMKNYEKPPTQNRTPTKKNDGNRFRLGPNWREKALPTFWSVGAGLSVILNFILLIVIVIIIGQMSAIKEILTNKVVGGLYYNFVLMDQATIKTTVMVEDNIAVTFDLPLQQNTIVILTEDTPIEGATVTMNTGGLNIRSAPTDIVLPEGTELPVKLDLIVPVNTEIPISLTVPVDIPLNETELHQPFVGLQDVVSPLFRMLLDPPSEWPSAPCKYWGIGCQ